MVINATKINKKKVTFHFVKVILLWSVLFLVSVFGCVVRTCCTYAVKLMMFS